MSFDNLTIPQYWIQINTGRIYKVIMINHGSDPIKYELYLCNPKHDSDETSSYYLTEEEIKQQFKEYQHAKPQLGWKELEFEYENVFKNSYGLTVCNLKPKLSDLKLETMEIHNGLIELWYSSKQEEGLFYYYFNYDIEQGSCELLRDSYDGILVFMVVPTVEAYASVLYERLN